MRVTPAPAALAFAVSLVCGQSVIHVDQGNCPGPGSGTENDPYCVVQSAIVAAEHGDEVIVAPGVYDEAIDLLGKRIRLRSSEGPDLTTLRNESGSIVTCTSGETLDTIVDGFTFAEGRGTWTSECTGGPDPQAYFGCGMLILGSSATIRNCIFRDNCVDPGGENVAGGAIYVRGGIAEVSHSHFAGNVTQGDGTVYGSSIAICGDSGHVTVTDSTFDSNGRRGVFGGGVYAYGTGATVRHCTFTNSKASFGAGVIGLPGGAVAPSPLFEVSDCVFTGNESSQGGALFIWAVDGAGAKVSSSTFVDNLAPNGGGGAALIYSSAAEVAISSNTFLGNMAHDGGGLEIVVSEDGTIGVDNCVFADNHAIGSNTFVVGGGITALVNVIGSIRISNCTVVDNSAVVTGGGIYTENNGTGTLDLANAIVRKNTPNQIVGPIDVRYSNVEDGFPGLGNIDESPSFVDAPAYNFRLLPESTCIDRGINGPVTSLTADRDGQPRFVEGTSARGFVRPPKVDLGAFEYPHGSLVRIGEDRATLTWPRIGNAVFYNVYRGKISALVDTDGDGLPDGGFGECVNDLDPDLSDTEFADEEAPDPSQGFYYLMSSVDTSGIESFLGTTSAGHPRQPLVPCP